MVELVELIKANQWEDNFSQAIAQAHKGHILEIEDIKNLHDYLAWMNGLLHWVPTEDRPGREVYNHLCKFYFILDQAPVLKRQTKVVPRPGPSR